MMKYNFLLLLILCLDSFYSENKKVFNKIDSLHTAEDIQKFILDESNKISYINVEDKISYKRSCINPADSINLKKTWEKADFDNNGLTDLFITGTTSQELKTLCILDKGNYFESHIINRGDLYEECSFSAVNGNKIEYQSRKILNRYGFISDTKENLIYKYGGFIEENLSPKRHNILEIQFENSGSYWSRSVLKMKIVSNRDIIWTTKNDGFLLPGIYTSKLSHEKFNKIIGLLNYLDFENLKDEYEVGFSDAATQYLTITYDNLKVKRIRDYGGMGTKGLQQLYNILADLKLNQEWVKQ